MTIIIPSMGRCGSTALFYAIRACIPPHEGRFVHYLADADIQDGEIIKTHDRAPDVIPDHWRVIYLHGDPEAIRRSVLVQSDEWKRAHFEHFGKVFADDQTSLIDSDGLDLAGNFASWRDSGAMCIHYDDLFESAGIISEFLGVSITLPPRKRRTT
jgi:hypothetical protein